MGRSTSDAIELHIRKTVHGLFRKNAIDTLEELDVEAIARVEGLEFADGDLDSAAARLTIGSSGGVVRVAAGMAPARRRFSIAHELGHYLLHRGNGYAVCSDSDVEGWGSSDRAERQANKFAAELLMPQRWASGWCENPGLACVRALCGTFGASKLAGALRMVELTHEPVLIGLIEGRQLKWTAKSRGFWLRDGAWGLAPTGSVAMRAVRSGRSRDRPEEHVSPAVWIDDRRLPDDVELLEEAMILRPGHVALAIVRAPGLMEAEDYGLDDW